MAVKVYGGMKEIVQRHGGKFWRVGQVWTVIKLKPDCPSPEDVVQIRCDHGDQAPAHGGIGCVVVEAPWTPKDTSLGRHFRIRGMMSDASGLLQIEEVLYDAVSNTWGLADVRLPKKKSSLEERQVEMKGAVYEAVVVQTETVAVAEGVATGVEKSKIVHETGKFVALSADGAKAVALADAIKKVEGLDPSDPTKPVEVFIKTFST